MKRKVIRYYVVLTIAISPLANGICQTAKDFQKVNESLNHYWYCKVAGCEKGEPFPSYIPYDHRYYDDRSKKQLFRIIDDKFTEQELQVLAKAGVDNFLKTQIQSLTSTKENTDLPPRLRKSLQIRIDSLVKITNMKVDTFPAYRLAIKKKEAEIKKMKIDDFLVEITGLTNDKRFIPVLIKAIDDTVRFNRLTVKLSLARFKEEPFHSEMLKRFRVNEKHVKNIKRDHLKLNDYYSELSRSLLYILTQESLFELSNFLPVELKVTDKKALNIEDVGYIPVSREAFESIISKIKNQEIKDYLNKYPKSFNVFGQYNVPSETPIDKKHIEFLQNWMKVNFGHYDIARD